MIEAAAAFWLGAVGLASAAPVHATCHPEDGHLTLALPGFALYVTDPGFSLQQRASQAVPHAPDNVPEAPEDTAGPSGATPPAPPPCPADASLHVTGIVPGSDESPVAGSWLMAMDQPHGGIYRLRRTADGVASTRVVDGSVMRLCDHGGVGWAALPRDGHTVLVRLSADDDTVVSRSLSAAVADALRAARDEDISEELLLSVLRAAGEAQWPETSEVVWAAAQHRSPVVRREAVRRVGLLSTRAGTDVAVMWVLSYDVDVQVRRSAFAAATGYCQDLHGTVCAELLGYFTDDQDRQISWGARDILLTFDPARALRRAPPTYKLDVLSALSVRLETDAPPAARRALDLLASDLDPEVRETAVLIVNRLDP